MTDEELAAIEASFLLSTPGEWRRKWTVRGWKIEVDDGIIAQRMRLVDAAWIMETHAVIPKLISEVRRLRKEGGW